MGTADGIMYYPVDIMILEVLDTIYDENRVFSCLLVIYQIPHISPLITQQVLKCFIL
jgi:hypothetical protein